MTESMKIAHNTVATFSYVMSNSEGEELERSSMDDPTAYLHGHNNILFALEGSMEGRQTGDSFDVDLEPWQAYGNKKEEAIQRVPVKHLLSKGKGKLKKGSRVKINTDQGAKDATVVKVGKFNVDVDTNHPLAGIAVRFSITIHDVREATREEIAHGHAHGLGGHHH